MTIRNSRFKWMVSFAILTALYVMDPAASAIERIDDIGGDDVFVLSDSLARTTSIDIASNGDIYAAVTIWYPHPPYDGKARIAIYRSQDGGDSWDSWGQLDALGDTTYSNPSILVCEGIVDRCYVACRYNDGVHWYNSILVAHSPLSSPEGDWTEVVAIYDGSKHMSSAKLASDAGSYDDYYLYLVAQGQGDGYDISFTRSTDQGASFETHYAIAHIDEPYTYHRDPDVSYGLGGYVHVVWEYSHGLHEFESAILNRRASSFANAGIASWETVREISNPADDIWDQSPRIAASLISDDVLIAYSRRIGIGVGPYADPGAAHSEDRGASYPNGSTIPDGMRDISSVELQPETGNWIIGGHDFAGPALQRAQAADPTTWTAMETFADYGYETWFTIPRPIALDPSRDHRAASFCTVNDSTSGPVAIFDAEWRGDPGYPNFADGFPLDLSHTPHSPPALVDIDNDGDLEILYSDEYGYLRAYHHDGQAVQGWPVNVAHFLADGPVAVGDLDGSNQMCVVAGTVDGLAVAYDAAGQPMPGWPVDTGTGEDVYISIGAAGAPEARTVVIASGNLLTFRNKQGELPDGAIQRLTGDRIHHAPCAIGDIDGDGMAEIVCGPSYQVLAVRMCESGSVFGRYLPSNISDAITLGDLDLDGEVEVIVPTADGTLYALNEDGSDFPTVWPFVSSTGSPLTSGAIAQVMSTFEPEVAVAARDWTVHLVRENGLQQSGFPVHTSNNWFIYGAPLIGLVTGSPDIMLGARDERVWSWGNVAELNAGWPKDLDARINHSPSYGDIDQDGYAELVVLTEEQLVVLDLNQVLPTPNRTWAMYGHDAQRTGCADCPENIPAGVRPEGSAGITRLSFTAPSLIARAGSVTFQFALPHYAAVALEIFDVQGRCLRTVLKAEHEAGEYTATWDGCDAGGHRLAAGQYLARLRVRGAGREQAMTRKLVRLP